MLSGHVKICRTCKEEKPTEDFGKNSRSSDGLKSECRNCNTIRSRQQRANNPGKGAEYSRRYREKNPHTSKEYHLRKTFDLTLERYAQMLKEQNGVCAICFEVNENGENLSVDHDRSCCPTVQTCGKCVRGLLCGRCNRAIGLLKDSVERIESAKKYLLSRRYGRGKEEGTAAGLQ